MDYSKVMELLTARISIELDSCSPTRRTVTVNEVVDFILDMLKSFLHCDSIDVSKQVTLDSPLEEMHMDDDSSGKSSCEEEQACQPGPSTSRESFSVEYMRAAVEYYDELDEHGKRKHSWKAFQHTFRRVPHLTYLARFREYLEHSGTKRQKLDIIEMHVWSMFRQARHDNLTVHEEDLRRWGMDEARRVDLDTFTASSHWVYDFKSRHRISSRHITKLVSFIGAEGDDPRRRADEFLSEVVESITEYPPENVFNTDQMGVEYEMPSKRTLSFKGESSTMGHVKSKNATTHSYTVQLMIALNGNLTQPVFLCLKEKDSHLSDRIKAKMFKPTNVIIVCSSSGKLTQSLVKQWVEQVYTPNAGTQSLLFSDAWTGQRKPELYADVPGARRIEIPAGTTSLIQPLDCYFNRQWKLLTRHVHERVRLDRLDISLSNRDNTIKLVSLVHNQLSAPVFHTMISYSWHQAGFLKKHPGKFESVPEVCFSFMSGPCSRAECRHSVFICCSHCGQLLCFQHFFIDYHFHAL